MNHPLGTIHHQHISKRHPVSGFALSGFYLAVLSVLSVIMAGFGSRWGWWDFRAGFTIMKWGGYGGLAALALSLVGAVLARPGRMLKGFMPAVAGISISLLIVGVLLSWMSTAKKVPPIHDISTDMEKPPAFVAILPLRANAANPAEYGGPEIAVQQRKAYPYIGPLLLPDPPKQAFDRALSAARGMNWEIVASDPAAGRIEATDRTFWFGFKDDVVVRITPMGNGSRIDVRSVSRVGKSDVGTNAKRIQKYLKKVKQLS
jgi:uncharacterized protein (DUF1499 family)